MGLYDKPGLAELDGVLSTSLKQTDSAHDYLLGHMILFLMSTNVVQHDQIYGNEYPGVAIGQNNLAHLLQVDFTQAMYTTEFVCFTELYY